MLQKSFIEKFNKKIKDSVSLVVKDVDTNGLSIENFTKTIQAIRDDISGEYDAIRLYEEHILLYTQLLEETQNSVYQKLIDLTQDIIKEEEQHVGELNELLNKVDPQQMQNFEDGVREAQEKLNGKESNTTPEIQDTEIWDERLSPMTYKKLKEMGYTSEKWKNLTQEQANKIVRGEEKPTQRKNERKIGVVPTTHPTQSGETKTKKEKKLAVPEGVELRQRIFSDTDGKMTIEEIESSDVVRKMGRDSNEAQIRIAKEHKIPKDEKTGTYSTSDISNPEREKMRYEIANEMLSRGSVGVDENGKTKKDPDGNVIYDGPVKREYRAEIVLGAPAGGKSSVIVDKVSKNTGSMVLDSDENKKLIPEFEDGIGAGLVHKESADIILEQLMVPQFGKGGSMEGTNIVIPIVGKNPRAALRYLKLLKEAGYTVNLSFNEVSTLNSVKRATTRAIETGRYLSPEYLRSIGDKPRQTYEYLQTYDEDGVHFDTFTKYNNDVRFGQPAELLEHKAFGGKDIEKEEWR